MTRTSRRMLGAASAAVILSALAAGCGSSSDSDSDKASADSGPTTLRVTTIGLCNEAIVWGMDQGVFKDAGLNIKLVTVQSGAAGIAALQSGDADVAFVNTLSAMQAIQGGVDMKVVSGSGLSTEGANAVVVAKDSSIESAKDLQGKKIAINQLGGLGQIVTQSWIARDAGSKSTAEFVTLPFADQVPAVAKGTVDAAQVTATQAQAGEKDGTTKSLGNPFFDGVGPIDTAVYLANADYVSKHEKALTSFADAMTTAADSANDEANDTPRFAAMAKYCKSTPEALAETPEPVYEGKLDMSAFGAIVDLLKDEKQISDLDVDKLVPSFARAK